MHKSIQDEEDESLLNIRNSQYYTFSNQLPENEITFERTTEGDKIIIGQGNFIIKIIKKNNIIILIKKNKI
jgi:hypothetical protein